MFLYVLWLFFVLLLLLLLIVLEFFENVWRQFFDALLILLLETFVWDECLRILILHLPMILWTRSSSCLWVLLFLKLQIIFAWRNFLIVLLIIFLEFHTEIIRIVILLNRFLASSLFLVFIVWLLIRLLSTCWLITWFFLPRFHFGYNLV